MERFWHAFAKIAQRANQKAQKEIDLQAIQRKRKEEASNGA